MNYLNRFFSVAVVIGLAAGFTACDKEEDNGDMPMPEAKLTVNDQTVSQNTVIVKEVDVPSDGFIVIHRDAGGGPEVPGIISEPIMVSEGTSMDIMVPILETESLTDGETLWVMLHEDTGTPGQYEFDGQNGFDPPFMMNGGGMVMTSIEITAPSITVMNQAVMNNTITIPEVNAAADGWLVVHNDDGSGGIVLPGIIGKTMVQKGINTNVVVALDPMNTYTPGQSLFPMLHLDNGVIGEYEFDGVGMFDGPEIFSNDAFPGNVIFTSFTVQ